MIATPPSPAQKCESIVIRITIFLSVSSCYNNFLFITRIIASITDKNKYGLNEMGSSSISAIDKTFCPDAELLAMLLSKIMAL